LRRAKRQRQFYFKQKVEIATLPSVARNDIALLDANEFYPVACDDNFFKRKGRQICLPKGEKMPTYDDQFFFKDLMYGVSADFVNNSG